MTSLACVCGAGLIHLMHNWAMPPEDSKTPGPQLPSLFVALAMMDLIYDNCFMPRRLEAMKLVFKRLYELVVSLLLLELGMQILWAPVERLIYLVIKIILRGTGLVSAAGFERNGNFWVGCVTVPLSLLILAFAGQATDHFHLLRDRTFWVQTKVELQVEPALKFLNRHHRATGRPLPRFAETLQRHKDAADMRRRGQFFLTHFGGDDSASE